MNANDILRKLTSRKFIAAASGFVAGLSMVFGLDGKIITSVAGAVVSAASVVSYIIAEGRVDAEGVKNAIEDAQQAADTIKNSADNGQMFE